MKEREKEGGGEKEREVRLGQVRFGLCVSHIKNSGQRRSQHLVQ
jgi:hypothetical protein